MTSSEDSMTIDEANAVLDYHSRFIENGIIRVYKENPSLDPVIIYEKLILEIVGLKQRITALESGSSQVNKSDQSDPETTLLNYTWKDIIPLAKASPVELTLFKEIETLSNPEDWVLSTLGAGQYTKTGDKVRYACWDGSKVVWIHYTGINPFNVQPGAVYKFTISEAVKRPPQKQGDYPYYFAIVSISPIFVKNLLDGEHTPLRPQVYQR